MESLPIYRIAPLHHLCVSTAWCFTGILLSSHTKLLLDKAAAHIQRNSWRGRWGLIIVGSFAELLLHG